MCKISFEKQIALIQMQLWNGNVECNCKGAVINMWLSIGNPQTTHQFNFAELDYRVRTDHDNNKETEDNNEEDR